MLTLFICTSIIYALSLHYTKQQTFINLLNYYIMKTTNVNTKESAKNVNNYIKYWNNLKENKGTINKCLSDFKNSIEMAKDDNFVKFCKSIFAKYESNKALNKIYYNKIKEAFKIGEIVSYKKNNNTTIQYERKCSEYDIYRYFYQLHKESK